MRETTEAHCILPQQVLRGAKLEVHFRILGRVLWPASSRSNGDCVSSAVSSSFSGMGNFGIYTKAISSMLKSSQPFSATLAVWQITLGGGASCDSSSVGISTRMLKAGSQFPDNGLSMPTVGDTVSGQSRRCQQVRTGRGARNSPTKCSFRFPPLCKRV